MELDDPDLPVTVIPEGEALSDVVNIELALPREEYDASFLLPDGWYQQFVPEAAGDVRQNPHLFVPLGIYSATKEMAPPIVFSVAVRPAHKTGTVVEWLHAQCHIEQIVVERWVWRRFAFGLGIDAVAMQGSDFGPMRMRMAMFEDGGRLFQLIGMATQAMWPAQVAALSLPIVSFELKAPKGQTTPVVPGFGADGPADQGDVKGPAKNDVKPS